MEIICAKDTDFERVKQHYWNIIDGMQDGKYPTAWVKGTYPSDEDLRGFISRKEMYLLQDNDMIFGSMAINHNVSDGYDTADWKVEANPDEVNVIHILGVNPQIQGQGIAKKLIDFAILESKKNNQKAIRLDALSNNIPAHQLYKSKGFEYICTVELYYDNTGLAKFLLFEYDLMK